MKGKKCQKIDFDENHNSSLPIILSKLIRLYQNRRLKIFFPEIVKHKSIPKIQLTMTFQTFDLHTFPQRIHNIQFLQKTLYLHIKKTGEI